MYKPQMSKDTPAGKDSLLCLAPDQPSFLSGGESRFQSLLFLLSSATKPLDDLEK